MRNYNSMSEEEQLEAVKQNGFAIQYIANPSEQVQLEAVTQYGRAIKWIASPSEQVQLEALGNYWSKEVIHDKFNNDGFLKGNKILNKMKLKYGVLE